MGPAIDRDLGAELRRRAGAGPARGVPPPCPGAPRLGGGGGQSASGARPAPTLPANAPDTGIRNVPATTGRANLPDSPPPFAIATIGQFDAPFAMAFLPGGALLVTEKAGRLQYRLGTSQVLAVQGVPTVATGGQGGLMGVAVAPDYPTSHAIYLTYSEGPDGQHSQLVLARGRLATAGERAAPTLNDVQVLWRSGEPGPGGQFGAKIALAPDGRSLYLSSGERQRFSPAQEPDGKLGKILHLSLDGKPMPGTRDGILTMGHRNPYGLAFAADGTLWESEMGPKGGDELNVIVPGRNYGWPIVSNGDNYSGKPIPDHPSRPDLEAPKLWWNPSISPGGMMIYSGAMFPQYRGNAFLGALSGEALIRVTLSGTTARPAEQWTMGTRIRDVKQAPDGSIWLLEDGTKGAGGKLMRLTPKS